MTNVAEVIKFPDKETRTNRTMCNGGVNVYRSLKDKSWYKNSEMVHLWTHLILSANHREQYWVNEQVCLGRGQYMTGLRTIQDETGINKNKVDRCLKKFEDEGMISQVVLKAGRIITLVNYDEYQSPKQQKSGTPTGHQNRTQNGTPLNHAKQGMQTVGGTQSGTPASSENEPNNKTILKDLKDSLSENSSPTNTSANKTIREGSVIESPNAKKWGTQVDLDIAHEIFDALNKILSGNEPKPNFISWANDVRLMRTIDKRDPVHIRKLFEFANQDPFWHSNVKCPQKLREKWSTLAIQRQDKKNATKTSNSSNRQSSNTQSVITACNELAQRINTQPIADNYVFD